MNFARSARHLAAHAATLGFFLAVATLFTWPTARFDSSTFYTRQFDLYGVLWMLHHVREVLLQGLVSSTNFPLGENATRPDAYVMAGLALLLGNAVPPLSLVRMIVLLGPVANAFAAERCAARGFHIRRPWSLLAGITYGFNGLAATAWLEGHVYFLFNPWLPLLLLALVQTTRPGAPRREGIKAGLYWTLALATSAYTGILATVLAAVYLVRALLEATNRREAALRCSVPLAVFLPFALVHAWLFFGGSGQRAPDLWRASTSGGATLAGLVTWWPGVDGKTYHSIATPLGFGMLTLCAFAPTLLRHERAWRPLLATASVSVLLSFGTVVSPGMGGTWSFPAPLALLAGTPIPRFLHFPVRFLWLTYLCGGLVAARAAARIAHQVGAWRTAPLLLVALLDAVALTGAPLRARPVLAQIPSAYNAAPTDRAVLDLFAEQPVVLGDMNTRVTKLTTYYHTVHRRPVLAAALPTHGTNCRDAVAAALLSELMDWQRDVARGTSPGTSNIEHMLADLGIGAVAVHLELFPEPDRTTVLEGLRAALGPPAAISHDGGETIVLHVLRTRSNADPTATFKALF